jgi:hypothetical protein
VAQSRLAEDLFAAEHQHRGRRSSSHLQISPRYSALGAVARADRLLVPVELGVHAGGGSPVVCTFGCGAICVSRECEERPGPWDYGSPQPCNPQAWGPLRHAAKRVDRALKVTAGRDGHGRSRRGGPTPQGRRSGGTDQAAERGPAGPYPVVPWRRGADDTAVGAGYGCGRDGTWGGLIPGRQLSGEHGKARLPGLTSRGMAR